MMGYYGGNMIGSFGLFGLVIWVSFIVFLVVFLVLGSMYFWKELNKKK